MRPWRGLVALALVVTVDVAASSCGNSSNTPTKPGAGGAGGSSQTIDGGLGGVSNPDASTGGTQTVSATCGNGQVESGEQCDDGNSVSLDGCENNCRFTCTKDTDDVLCQDHDACDGHEVCSADHHCQKSPGPAPDGTQCGGVNVCKGGVCIQANANCGDGIVVAPEECDPGTDGGNGVGCVNCRFVCTYLDPNRSCASLDICSGKSVCNEATHACLPGTPVKDLTPCDLGKVCVAGLCTGVYCSNQKLDPGEECDDGNLVKGDGCEPNCKFTCKAGDKNRDCHTTNACLIDGTCDASSHVCSAILPKTAGTACGTGDDCVQGNCDAPICGDGIVAVGVEACDDGNAVDGDGCNHNCVPSCTAATAANACKSKVAPCSVATCTSGICGSAPDTASTATCYFGGGTVGTCSNGLCGTCGNGKKDSGEFCDDGNAVRGDGCEPDCTFSCNTAPDCNDGDPCNGAETCASHQCAAGTSEADGAACGTGKVCMSGSCRPSYCGDGYVDAAKGETCDPPNTVGCDSACHALAVCNMTGDWALKVTANVSWGDGQNLEFGQDTILQWASLHVTQTGGTFTATLRPCGLVIPDFKTTSNLGGEWYGITFPDTIWTAADLPSFPIAGTVSSTTPGAAVETSEAAILLGVTIDTPPGPLFATWPDDPTGLLSAPFHIVDQDDNGRVGITGLAKKGVRPPGSFEEGAPYADPLANINVTPFARADELDIAIRQTATLLGQLDTCTSMSGSATPPPVIDNHIIGCRQDDAAHSECKTDWYQLPDSVRPRYAIISNGNTPGATFKATKLPNNPLCADVRTALP